jgi:hypothetical protein
MINQCCKFYLQPVKTIQIKMRHILLKCYKMNRPFRLIAALPISTLPGYSQKNILKHAPQGFDSLCADIAHGKLIPSAISPKLSAPKEWQTWRRSLR